MTTTSSNPKSEETGGQETATLLASHRSLGLAMSVTDIIDILTKCCANRAPAVIVLPEVNGFCQGQFVSVSDQSITFDLCSEPPGEGFKPSSLCCVSFFEGGSSCVFLASIRQSRVQAEKQPQLVLELPPGIARAETRSALRLPVFSDSGLSAELLTADSTPWAAQAVDISLCGIQVQLPADNDPELSVGDRLEVILRLDDEVAILMGEVRRRSGRRYGLFFPESIRDGLITAPNALSNIVKSLEKKFQQRAEILDEAFLNQPPEVLEQPAGTAAAN